MNDTTLGADPSKLKSIKKNLELIKLVATEPQVLEYVELTIKELDELIKGEEF